METYQVIALEPRERLLINRHYGRQARVQSCEAYSAYSMTMVYQKQINEFKMMFLPNAALPRTDKFC